MMAPSRFIPLTLCYRRRDDLFGARFISPDPEAFRLIPALASPYGVPVSLLTADQLTETFGVDPQLVIISQSNPDQWYEVASGTFHEADPLVKEEGS